MIETELKAVVPELAAARQRVESAGGRVTFAGRLEDRRYDRPDLSLAAIDHVLRLRVYRDAGGNVTGASIDWKGPSSTTGTYKQREELSSDVGGDPEDLARILERLGFVLTMQIDRSIWQYDLEGAAVRFERYPRMDDLVEVEGSAAAIERAIAVLELPRDSFTTDSLFGFMDRYQRRTGKRPIVCAADLGDGEEQW